jgi:ABC-2 type transport system permease protein/lipopolysaccharide transport system permease protein
VSTEATELDVRGTVPVGGEKELAAGPPPEILFKRRHSLIGSIRELGSYDELILSLAERDLRTRYKQAGLGVAWAVITPLLLMLAFTFVFTKFTKVDTGGAPYALFSYLGLIPWTFFASALSLGSSALTNNVSLLNKVYCPREVFPLSQVIIAAFDAVIATLVLIPLFLILGYAPSLELYYAPLLLLVLLAFVIGVTLATSIILIYMRDLRFAVPLIIQFGIFVTPVAYNADVVADTPEKMMIYSILNPLVPVIGGLRRCILYGEAPLWWPLFGGACTSVVLLVVGYWMFKRLETGIADVA